MEMISNAQHPIHTYKQPLYGCWIDINSAKVPLTPFDMSKNKPFCCMTSTENKGIIIIQVSLSVSQHQYLHNKSHVSDYSLSLVMWNVKNDWNISSQLWFSGLPMHTVSAGATLSSSSDTLLKLRSVEKIQSRCLKWHVFVTLNPRSARLGEFTITFKSDATIYEQWGRAIRITFDSFLQRKDFIL